MAIEFRKCLRGLLAAALAISAAAPVAGRAGDGDIAVGVPEAPEWEWGPSVLYYVLRDEPDFLQPTLTVDRGALHLEARYNYESIGARSAFVGWTFSGGEDLNWELTPLLGGAWGDTRGFVPGLEASLSWKSLDFYLEGEYVRSGVDVRESYLYAWSELGYSPFEWLRLGLAGQRTNAYDSGRDIQRGPFVQFTWRRMTVGGYWFNPGSDDQIVVSMIGVSF